ncbi:hypothetical protein [Caldimonas tepidiphila]|uniref:hypothetical protein n=1 Tax=Caldimonas tepidiphila TaxID=2315841 RepID=UPI0013004458|nr:hypothetical protein [Caldimonas tepidiphila]
MSKRPHITIEDAVALAVLGISLNDLKDKKSARRAINRLTADLAELGLLEAGGNPDELLQGQALQGRIDDFLTLLGLVDTTKKERASRQEGPSADRIKDDSVSEGGQR